MAIIVITGPAKSGKTALAQSLRATAIGNGRGALLIDDFEPHDDPAKQAEAKHLVEKLLAGAELPADVLGHRAVRGDKVVKGIDALPWKPDPLIVLIGERGVAKLKEIEKLVPGFTEKFGPVSQMPISPVTL